MATTGTMTPDIIQRAANVMAPMSGNCAVLSVTDTVALFAIPATWYGKFITAMMDGANADILFGSSSVVCVYGQASSVDGTTKVITVNAGSGAHMKDGVETSFQIPGAGSATHFSVDCVASGSGKLYIRLS